MGEYSNVLNWFGPTRYYHWGWGIELSGYDILCVRLGGYLQPFSSVFGQERVAAIRLGAGVRLPFRLLVPDAAPFACSIDYAAIPLYDAYFLGAPATANVFSLTLSYEADIFGGHE